MQRGLCQEVVPSNCSRIGAMRASYRWQNYLRAAAAVIKIGPHLTENKQFKQRELNRFSSPADRRPKSNDETSIYGPFVAQNSHGRSRRPFLKATWTAPMKLVSCLGRPVR